MKSVLYVGGVIHIVSVNLQKSPKNQKNVLNIDKIHPVIVFIVNFGDFMSKSLKAGVTKGARPTSFFFHYNKPQSKAQGKPVISFHWKGQCHLVNNIVCNVKTKGRISKRQPYFVMAGKCISCLFIEVEGLTTVVVDL